MSKYTYLLVYNQNFGTFEEVKNFVDNQSEIINWYSCLPNSFFFVSELTANQLNEKFKPFNSMKEGGRFIILDTDTDRNGWLPKKTWDFIKNPKGVSE